MQLESNLHKIVNGYANSWIVNVDEICADISTTTFCSVDEDGLYSIEMVVSYNKQLLRYIGTALLLAFIVAILLYYVYSFLVIKALIKIKGKNR